jgi:hypothetical protein
MTVYLLLYWLLGLSALFTIINYGQFSVLLVDEGAWDVEVD